MPIHLPLHVDGTDGTQPVEVEPQADGAYRVLCSPGFVEGIAAGDLVRVLDSNTGEFEVLERGGNLGLKVYSDGPIGPVREFLLAQLRPLGGRVDGAARRAAVFTVPATAGFQAIDSCMARMLREYPGAEWHYGNVYADDGTPLNWW